ncbi:Na+-transporting NADH:ubiquinone oxidoreductase subunit D [Devosia subaequoris]|uniref:Na+-transporting NADH:ubiquinone oxidoreductase subunit D n=1 Tax=Devosia subaequoris TaxID=395930 RepID=A0A7W6IM26_9HYPH|nr:NADH:ubiquinone reductase (Na(+)-transporting) subunit D [Devosia subaequoris]MBB4052140.1 Na+-transporting NADH:ubiquinone oxidoreductase subunit D [Devosia subaequoris]MCP1209305.1 NADH:ubiquinone reductase (Na(+)-transporting) subunit D [Devosia subaequoris]
MKPLRHLYGPLVDNNPVTLQILGICSALAVTTSMTTALVMSLALIVVLVASSMIISAIRHHIPTSIRLILQITIIASLVIVADQVIQAFAFDISQRLSIFVGLIVTNCLVLGRAEAFAMRNPVGLSALDALGNGLGYGLVLLLIGFVRELFGAGTLFGQTVFPTIHDGGWFTPLNLMLLAPSAFFLLGLLIWAIRSVRPAQIELADYEISIEPNRRAP